MILKERKKFLILKLLNKKILEELLLHLAMMIMCAKRNQRERERERNCDDYG